MAVRRSRVRRSRRRSPCKYGRKKSMRHGCKSKPGPKRRRSRRKSPKRRSRFSYNMNRRQKKREKYAEQAAKLREGEAKYGKLVGSWNKAPGQSGWSKVEDDSKLHYQLLPMDKTDGLDHRYYKKKDKTLLEEQRIMEETVCPENTIIHTFKHKDSVRDNNYICSNNQYPCFDKKSSCLPAKNSSLKGSMLGRVEQVKKYHQRREVAIKAAAKARKTAVKAMERISKKVDKTVKSVVKLNEVAKQTEEKLKAAAAVPQFTSPSAQAEFEKREHLARSQELTDLQHALAKNIEKLRISIDEINAEHREAVRSSQEGQLIDTNFAADYSKKKYLRDPFDAYNMR